MSKNTVDMTKGSVLRHIVAFAIPIMISGILQTLYNAADMVVVGKFAGKESLAAVGSTVAAINLMIGVFIGLSSATNVVVARKFGAGNKTGVSKAVHNAIAVSVISGIILAIAGVLFSRTILLWMGSPDDVIELSTLYMQIYFAGVPAVLLYNFGSAIMRAVGDAKRPTYFLMLSGTINVLLNLLFVIVFKMGVAGVAIATVISQIAATVPVLMCLIKTDECFKLYIKKIKVHFSEFKELIALGIPAGLQGSLFSLSNVIIQSSINACGSDAMAGNSASCSVEGLVYVCVNCFYHATLTFVGQNYGAHNFKRIRKGYWTSMSIAAVFGALVSFTVTYFGEFLLGFYTGVPEVLEIGMQRMRVICAAEFLCGMMEVGTGGLGGMGVAVRSLIICLIGACGLRIVIIIMGAPYKVATDLIILYRSYPITWIITTVALSVLFFGICNSREKKWKIQKEELCKREYELM